MNYYIIKAGSYRTTADGGIELDRVLKLDVPANILPRIVIVPFATKEERNAAL